MIFPACIVAEPQELAVLIGHLTRDADLVAVEVVGGGILSTFAVLVGGGSIGEPRATSGLKVFYGDKVTYDYQLVIGLCKFAQNFNNDCSKK